MTNPVSTPEGESPSQSSPNLTLLHSQEAFQRHLLRLLQNGGRQVFITTQQLDPALYGHTEVCDALSLIPRRHRQSEIQIFIRDSQGLVGSGHRLIRLQQRLSSKISIRRSTTLPHPDQFGFVVIDQQKLLFQHQDGNYEGFCDLHAGPKASSLVQTFREQWNRESEEIPELRTLAL